MSRRPSQNPPRLVPPGAPLLMLVMALGIAGAAAGGSPVTPAITASGEIPEDLLLDVGVRLFDPGLPAAREELLELAEKGVYPDVRKAEAHYFPVRLMDTLQWTAQWGAVRIVPDSMSSLDLVVWGRILESNGLRLELEVSAVDASGRVWLADKRYKEKADTQAYSEEEIDTGYEPYQGLYNEIVNDLLRERQKLSAEELRELRQISELRFAADVVPAAFADYLGRDRKGRTVVARLPADGDPMLERVRTVRQRDEMYVDTLTEYWVSFRGAMEEHYTSFRRYSYDEELARRKLKRQAKRNHALAAIAVLGGIAIDANSRSTSGMGTAGVIVGSVLVQGGMAKAQEAKMHRETLRELAASLDSELEPLLIDVEGETVRLTGTMDGQYDQWREILRQIFIEETGQADPDAPRRTTPLASGEPGEV